MNNVSRHDLFITSVWTQKLTGFENINKNLLKNVFNTESPVYSDPNVYGGQESSLTYDESLLSVLSIAESSAKDIAKFMGVVKENNNVPKVSCFWGNVNKEKQFNPPHVHANSDLSGAYYVKIPTSEEHTEDQDVAAGKICFHDTRLEKCASTPLYEENLGYLDLASYSFPKGTSHNPWLDNVAKFKPEEGMMIIFPSWLLHYVEPNLCKEDRITISFNISF